MKKNISIKYYILLLLFIFANNTYSINNNDSTYYKGFVKLAIGGNVFISSISYDSAFKDKTIIMLRGKGYSYNIGLNFSHKVIKNFYVRFSFVKQENYLFRIKVLDEFLSKESIIKYDNEDIYKYEQRISYSSILIPIGLSQIISFKRVKFFYGFNIVTEIPNRIKVNTLYKEKETSEEIQQTILLTDEEKQISLDFNLYFGHIFLFTKRFSLITSVYYSATLSDGIVKTDNNIGIIKREACIDTELGIIYNF